MRTAIIPVLIGGSITLVGTFLVQIFVIPRVQVRTRGRERWERDVIELTALVEEELPRALKAYRLASGSVRLGRLKKDDPGVDQQRLETLLQSWEKEQRETDAVLGEKMARLDVLERRIRRLRPNAPYWQTLTFHRLGLQVAIWDVEPWRVTGSSPPDDESWEAAWGKIKERREAVLDSILKVADPPRPPKRRIIFRTRSRLIMASKRTASRLANLGRRLRQRLRRKRIEPAS